MTSENSISISQNSTSQPQTLDAQMHRSNSAYDIHVTADSITGVHSNSTNQESVTVSSDNKINNRRLNPEAREFMPPTSNMYMMPDMMPPVNYDNYNSNFNRPREFEVPLPHSEIHQPYTQQTGSRRGRGAHGTFAASRNQYYNSYTPSPLPQSTPAMPSRYRPNNTLINNYTNNENAQIVNLEPNSRQRRNRYEQSQQQQQQQQHPQNLAQRRKLFDAEQDQEIVEEVTKYVQQTYMTENNFVDVVINLEEDMTADKLTDLFYPQNAKSALILDQNTLPYAVRKKCDECQFRIGVVFFDRECFAKLACETKNNFAPYKKNKLTVRYCGEGKEQTAPSANSDVRSVSNNNNNSRTNTNNDTTTQRLLQQHLEESNNNNRSRFGINITHAASASAGVVHHISQDRVNNITNEFNHVDENDDGYDDSSISNRSREDSHHYNEVGELNILHATPHIDAVFNAIEQKFIDKYRTQPFHLVVVHGLKSDTTPMEWREMVRPFLSVGAELGTEKYYWQDTECRSGVSLFREVGNAKLAKSKLHKRTCEGRNVELIARYISLLSDMHGNDHGIGEGNNIATTTATPVNTSIFAMSTLGINNNNNNNNRINDGIARSDYRNHSTGNQGIATRFTTSSNYNVPTTTTTTTTNLSTPSLQASRLETPLLENWQLMLERLPESERHVQEEQQHNNYGNGASTPRLAPMETTVTNTNTHNNNNNESNGNYTQENAGLKNRLSGGSPYMQAIKQMLHAEEIDVVHLALYVRDFIHCSTSSVSEMHTLAALLESTLLDNQHNECHLHTITETLQSLFDNIHQRNLREAENKKKDDDNENKDGDEDNTESASPQMLQNGKANKESSSASLNATTPSQLNNINDDNTAATATIQIDNQCKETFAKCKETSLIKFFANRLVKITFDTNASQELRIMAASLCGKLYNLYHEPTNLPECVYEKVVDAKEVQQEKFMSASTSSFPSGSASAYTPTKEHDKNNKLHESYMAWKMTVNIVREMIMLCQRGNVNKATWDSMLCELNTWECELEELHKARNEVSRTVERSFRDEDLNNNERTPGSNRFEANIHSTSINNNTINVINRSSNVNEGTNRGAVNENSNVTASINTINNNDQSNNNNNNNNGSKIPAKGTLTPSARPTPRALHKYVIPNPEVQMTSNTGVMNERYIQRPPEVQLSNTLMKPEFEWQGDCVNITNNSSGNIERMIKGISNSGSTPYRSASKQSAVHPRDNIFPSIFASPLSTRTQGQSYCLSLESSSATPNYIRSDNHAVQTLSTTHTEGMCNPVPDVLMKTPLNARQAIAPQSSLTPYVLTNSNRTNLNSVSRNELLSGTSTTDKVGATQNSLTSPFLNYQSNVRSNSNSNRKSNSHAESMDKKARTVKIIRLPDKLMVSKVRRLLLKFGQLNKVRIKHDKENKENQKMNEFAEYGQQHESSFATHSRASDEICVMYVEFHERKEADSIVRFFRNINSSDNKLPNSLREPWTIQVGPNKTTVELQFTEEEIQWLKQTSVTHANNYTEKEIELDAKWPLNQGGIINNTNSTNNSNNNNNNNNNNSNSNSGISVPDKECEFGLYTPYATVYEYDEKKEEFEKREIEKMAKPIISLPVNFAFASLSDPNYTLLPAANMFMPAATTVDPSAFSQTYLQYNKYNAVLDSNQLTSIRSLNEADHLNSAPSSNMEKQVTDKMNVALLSKPFFEHDDDEDVEDDHAVHKTDKEEENFALLATLLHSQHEIKTTMTNALDSDHTVDSNSILPAFGNTDNCNSGSIHVTTTTTTICNNNYGQSNNNDDNHKNNADDIINNDDDDPEFITEWNQLEITSDDDADWYKKTMEENAYDDNDMS